LETAWEICGELGFWMIVGFLLAGAVGQLLPFGIIKRHLAREGWGSVFKAVLVGIPLPLCSCGIIPVAASLRKAGASKGAVAAFSIATPQSGIESIAVTYSLMGLPFTIVRVLADLVAGLFAGCLISSCEKRGKHWVHDERLHPCEQCETQELAAPKRSLPQKLKAALREGLIDLPADIGKYVLTGVLIGALLVSLFPDEAMAEYLTNPWISYTVVSLLAVMMYVCATGSIPIAYGLVAMGFSPGAAIIFLTLGPATNPSTIAVLWKILGRSASMIYLGVLIVASWLAAYGFDLLGMHLSGALSDEHAHEHVHGEACAHGCEHAEHAHEHFGHFHELEGVFAVLMLLLFAVAFYVRWREGGKCHMHAGHHHDKL